MTKLCECGCGNPAPIARQNDKTTGRVKGQPMRFINNHHAWKGGTYITGRGYKKVKAIGHPRADSSNYVFEHILVAEKAIGRFLPKPIELHHVNEIKADNGHINLVICENGAYHALLHQRARAYKATGSVLGVKCSYCKQWALRTDPNIKANEPVSGRHHYHRICAKEFFRKYDATRKARIRVAND